MKSLDEFMPEYEFWERHSISVGASPERVDSAVRELTLRDLPLVRVLFWLRGMRWFDAATPLLAQMAQGGEILEDVPGEGIAFRLRGRFWSVRGQYRDGPQADAVADFRVEPGGLSTETRVHVADFAGRRQFRRYWRLIRPFSGLVRILVLRAARRRAEAAS